MITDYSQHRPGISIDQLLAADTTSSAPAMASCLVGPKCLLNRYGRETIPGAAFNAAGQTLSFQRLVDSIATDLDLELFTVDQDFVKLYGEKLEASLATFTAAGSPSFKLVDLSEPNVIKLTSDNVAGSSLATALRGRSVAIGDVVYCRGIDGGTVFRRTVAGLRGVVGVGSYGSNLAGNDSTAGNVSGNPIDSTASAAQVAAPAGWTIGCGAPEDFVGLARGAKNVTEYGEEFNITVHTAGSSGTRQVETATVVGSIGVSGAGNASVIVTAAGLTGSPITLSVAVANSDTASQVAGKIRTALGLNANVIAMFVVGGTGATVTLTSILAAADDGTLNISIDNDTCTGLTAAPTSVNTTAGVAGTATVNILSASGLYNATNIATTTLGGAGTFTITDTNAGGELAGVTLVLTPPGSDNLAAGMSFRIRIVGDYARLVSSQVILSGAYTGVADTIYSVRVTQTNTAFGANWTGAKVTITDTSGIDTPQVEVTLTQNTNIALGSFGLYIKLAGAMPVQGGLRVGDTYFIRAKAGAVSATDFDQVVLSGPAVDTLVFTDVADELFSVEFRLTFTGEITSTAASGGEAWTSSASTITAAAALDYFVTARDDGYEWCAFTNGVGTLKPSYRAFYNAGDSNTMLEISTAAELVSVAGAVDLDNPLGYAAQQALLGADGKAIWILNTGGILSADFTAALATIANTRIPYDITILSEDAAIWSAALAHAVSASAADNLNFRRVRFGVNSPGEYVVLNKRADTTNFTCTISPHGGGNKLVTIIDGAGESSLTALGLVAGDKLKLTDAAVTYLISEVLSDTEFLLSSGPSAVVDPAVACQIYKADTVASQKAWLIARALALADRRASMVWVEKGVNTVNGVTTVIPTMFGAAYLSGLRSNLKAQIGLTRQNVSTFVSAPAMYNRYSRQDLDEIAAAGVQILEQSYAGASVRVRHQATTDTSNGILNYEESTTVRFDYLCFLVNSTLESSIGRVNTTEAAVEEARAQLLGVLNGARLVSVGANYGPLVDDFTNLVVQRSAQFLDRIEASVDVEFGPPVNRQAVTITAYGILPVAA